MGIFLYRAGRFAYRRRRWVAAAWLGLLVASVAAAVTLAGTTNDNNFSIPGAESQEALDRLEERFPEAAADGATARVVFAAPDGQTLNDPAIKPEVDAAVAELGVLAQVARVRDPFATGTVSQDGTIGFAQVTYAVPSAELTDGDREQLLDVAAGAREGGLTVEVGGDATEPPHEQGATEVIGVAVAALVLAITFGSLVAAGLPIITAVVGVGIGMATLTTLTRFIDMSSSTSSLAMMLGLAVAIDYAMFILSRYRHELAHGNAPEEAAGWAVGTAGSAVVFAGLTVIIALAALSVVGIPALTMMGLAAAGTVAIAVLIALTLLPALIGFAGVRVAGRHSRDPEAHDAPNTPGLGLRWAKLVTNHPVATLMAAAVLLAVVSIPAADLRLALPDDGMADPASTQRKAYDLISEGFGPGFNGPLIAVADLTSASDPEAAAAGVAETIERLPGVVSVSQPSFNQAGDTALLQIVPATGPNDAATTTLVKTIRGEAYGAGTSVAVTGQTAIQIDFSDRVGEAMIPYLFVVVGLALVLLLLVFRSVLVPLKAAAGFLATIAATVGAVVAVFQWGWLAGLFGVSETGPILSLMPIFLVGIVFGLAMDYEVFLVTRMREAHVRGATATESIVAGFDHSAGVVAAAAIIMLSVFSGFILADDTMVKLMGFALAVGVLFDAFVVRMTVVPAVMQLMGRSAWWLPAWMERTLPDVDVEGSGLHRELGAAELETGAGVA